jgi:PAS domain S-box-containing protein
MNKPTRKELMDELAELRLRLEEAEDTLSAIRQGEVDALVVSGPEGDQIFTLKGADHSYRTLVETINEGAATLARDGKILYANRRLAELLQTPLERLIGSHLQDYVSPRDRPLVEALFQIHQEDHRDEVRLRAAKGAEVPCLLSVSRMPPEDFSAKLSLVVTDLREQKRQEEILAAGRLSRAILEQAEQAIVVCNARGIITQASQATLRLYQGNLLRQPFQEVLPLRLQVQGSAADLSSGELFSLSAVLQGEIFHGVEASCKRRDGRELYVLLNAGPLYDEQGSVLGCVVSLTDVTERKRAEEETQRLFNIIHAEKEKLTALVNNISDEVWFADTQKKFTLANPAALREFGLDTFEEIDVARLAESLEVYRADGSPRLIEESPALRALQGEMIRDLEEIIRTPATGELRYRQVSSSPVKDENGNIMGSVSVVRDVTERKAAEEALRRAHDELERRVEERTAALRLANEKLQREIEERRQAEARLRQSEARFAAFMKYLPGAAVLRDIQGRYIFANETWERLTGQKQGTWQGKTAENIWPPPRARNIRDADFAILSKGGPAQSLEELDLPDGRHYFLVQRFPIPDESGLPYMVGSIAVDISARRRAEMEATRQAAVVAGMNRILRETLSSETEAELGRTCLAVAEELTASRFGFIDEINEQSNFDALAFSDPGWELCTISPVLDLAHLKNIKPVGLLARPVGEGKTLMTNNPSSHPDASGTPEGHPPLTAFLGVPLRQGGRTIGLVGVGNKAGGYTLADQKSLESLAPAIVEALSHYRSRETLKKSEKKLRFLADQLLTAQENERKRLAAELHDELGHALLTLKLVLSSIAKELFPTQENLKQEIQYQLVYLDEVIEEVRRLYSDLSPGNLEDLGLTDALHALIENFASLQGHIAWEADLPDLDGLFSLPVQTIIYRTVQEALTNIGKHADPEHVTVTAVKEGSQVRFAIQDDGSGFDVSRVLGGQGAGGGLGLAAMEERLHMVGDSFAIQSREGEGTRLSFTIPIPPEGERS